MITLKRAVDGYLLDRSTFLSASTINDYTFWLSRFYGWLGEERDLASVTNKDINAFFRYLKDDYVVTAFGNKPLPEPRRLSPKSRKNCWIDLKAFWVWCEKEFQTPSPMNGLKGPKVQEKPVEPYTDEQIKNMLAACDRTNEWNGRWKAGITSERPSALRDKAIILFLLDSGVRATELCNLNIADFDEKTGGVIVRHGKGDKSRHVFTGIETRKHTWRYLAQRFPDSEPDPKQPLFVTRDGARFQRFALRTLLCRIGKKAGIPAVNVHRFRHTFAIMFLRGGGHELALRRLLGHTQLRMTQRYVNFASEDIAEEHRLASPTQFVLKK